MHVNYAHQCKFVEHEAWRCSVAEVPVISGRQECTHSGDLSTSRAPSFAGPLTHLTGGVGGYVHQVSLDAVQHLTHKGTDVLAQNLDQAAEQVTCPCGDSLHNMSQTRHKSYLCWVDYGLGAGPKCVIYV